MTPDFGPTCDFSPVAPLYDATRDIPRPVLRSCYDRLIALGLFPARGRVLDAGCGTGQISLLLAEQGYAVQGFDISDAMVHLAQGKVGSGWQVSYVAADIRDLPCGDASVDVVIVSKLFMHISDWRTACRELIRVVGRNGPVVHIKDRGVFGNPLRKFFGKRADEAGFRKRFVGLPPESNTELSAYMASQGYGCTPVDLSDLSWEVRVAYGDAVQAFRDRLFAEFWPLPLDVYDRILAETVAWVDAQPEGDKTVAAMRGYLMVDVFDTGTEASRR